MKTKAEVATAQISNDLHEQLSTKDAVSFWEKWKNKINNNNNNDRLTAFDPGQPG